MRTGCSARERRQVGWWWRDKGGWGGGFDGGERRQVGSQRGYIRENRKEASVEDEKSGREHFHLYLHDHQT